jgi:hypothetical protein
VSRIWTKQLFVGSLPLGNCPYSPTSTRVTHLNPRHWQVYFGWSTSIIIIIIIKNYKNGVWSLDLLCLHTCLDFFYRRIQPKFDLILAKIRFPIILRIFPLKKLPKNRQIKKKFASFAFFPPIFQLFLPLFFPMCFHQVPIRFPKCSPFPSSPPKTFPIAPQFYSLLFSQSATSMYRNSKGGGP